MYPSTSLFIAVGQLAIVILVLFSYPLQVHPCRNCLDKVFHPAFTAAAPKVTVTDVDAENNGSEGDDDHGHGPVDMSRFKYIALTSAIIISGFTIACLVDDLQLGKCYQPCACIVTSSYARDRSAVVCWCDRINDDFVYSPRSILLEGNFIYHFGRVGVLMKHRMPQLTRGDGSSRALNSGAFALMIYGLCVFVFWCVPYLHAKHGTNKIHTV